MKWLMKKRHGGIDSCHARGRFSCLLGVLLLVHTSVWADLQGSITLSLKQATVSEFVEAVQKQYDIGFIYDYNKLKDLHVADIDVEDATIEQVLELALKGTGFVGEIRNGVIVIKKEEKPQQQQVEGAKTIKGKVMDVEGVGLPGVTVLIKGTGLGVATDENDRLLGYAFCVFKQYLNDNIMTDIKTLYIDDLCVDEVCRGQHIGRTLYEAVLAYAREHGCYNVTLNVWAGNDKAQGFYESCGFRPQKTGKEIIL